MSVGLILNLLNKLNKSMLCEPFGEHSTMYYFIQRVQQIYSNTNHIPPHTPQKILIV